MGYTHYWNIKTNIPLNEITAFVADCQKIVDRNQNILCFEYDKPDLPAICSSSMVRFNGIDEDGHETFMFAFKETDFEFCKTARKPYDICVTACLTAAKFHFGKNIVISSDGRLDEWEDGIALFVAATGKKTPEKILDE